MVCRVFKKKNTTRGFQQQEIEEEEHFSHMMRPTNNGPCHQILESKHHHHNMQGLYDSSSFDGTIHLPQLFSPESAAVAPTNCMNTMDILECSQNLLRLTTTTTGCGLNLMQQQQGDQRFTGDWSFLDKLLASHHPTQPHHAVGSTSAQKFPFHYLGNEAHDIMKFSK